ncbi:hypothetical protein [Rubrolithibacter danxiaensis]|uniref:hypothetical protein n=1 Tax=Rubrolithibacter danxiaensis TaxID=3390805 RepID=UPI003BF7FC26
MKLRDSNGKEFLVGIIIFFGLFLYFIYDFTRVYPPLKKYEYSGSMSQFAQDLQKISTTNPQIVFDITDTTGSAENGFAYYIKISIKGLKKNNEYYLAYKEDDSWFSQKETKLNLNGAFDLYRKSGGYKLEDTDVKRLVHLFDQDFYEKLVREKNTSP